MLTLRTPISQNIQGGPDRFSHRRQAIDMACRRRRHVAALHQPGGFESAHALCQHIGADWRKGCAQVREAKIGLLEVQENLQRPATLEEEHGVPVSGLGKIGSLGSYYRTSPSSIRLRLETVVRRYGPGESLGHKRVILPRPVVMLLQSLKSTTSVMS